MLLLEDLGIQTRNQVCRMNQVLCEAWKTLLEIEPGGIKRV